MTKLRTNPPFILIVNLAISEVISCGCICFQIIVGLLIGDIFRRDILLCNIIGTMIVSSTGTALVNLGLLAFNRYVSVFYKSNYKNIFSIRKTIVYCILAWIVNLFVDVISYNSGLYPKSLILRK